MNLEENKANPLITVSLEYRVDKKHTWSTNFAECRLEEFKISDLEFELDEAIKMRGGSQQGWFTHSIVAVVKAKGHGAVQQKQPMDELSGLEWIKASALIVREAKAFKPIVTISITVNAEADKEMIKLYKKAQLKQAHADLSSDPQDPEESSTPRATGKRLIRTDKLLDQANIRATAAEEVGKYNKQLLDHWVCNDPRCANANTKFDKAWCWVEIETGDHDNMDQAQQFKWAKAMQQKDPVASIEHPPANLYREWIHQGPIQSSSKKPGKKQERAELKYQLDESKSVMQQFKEMQEASMSMAIQE